MRSCSGFGVSRPSVGDALRFAGRIQRSCAGVLGGAVAGVILHGSLTLGDYVPGRSDVDLLAVVEEPLGEAHVGALAATVGDEWRRERIHFDLRVVTRKVASAPTAEPAMEMEVSAHPGSQLGVVERQSGERDLVVELSMCRACGRSLAGSEPSQLLGSVPDEWVQDAGAALLAEWQERQYSPPHAELMVLTACRVWRFSEERRHCAKSAAGEWALTRDPSLQVIRDALHQRREGSAFPIGEGPIREFLAVVRAHVQS